MKIRSKKRINKYTFIIVIILLVQSFFCNSLHPQQWLEDKATELFKYRFIDDFGFVNNNLWVRCSPYLFRFENNKLVRYFLNNPSNGSIEKFCDTTNYGNFYPNRMNIINNKIWLLGENQFIMIHNDTIYSLKFLLSDENIKHFSSIDNKGNLYILTQKYINDNSSDVCCNLYYSNGFNDFKELALPILNYKEIDGLIIYNEKKIISGWYKNYDGILKHRIEIFDNQNTQVNYIECDSINTYLDNYYFNESNVFLLNRGKEPYGNNLSYLHCIDSVSNVNIYRIPYKLSKTCYYFLVNKDFLFFSDSFGFYKYNLLDNSLLQIPELVDRSIINQTAMRNMIIHNNILYGCYSNDIQGCGLISFHGLYLYKLD